MDPVAFNAFYAKAKFYFPELPLLEIPQEHKSKDSILHGIVEWCNSRPPKPDKEFGLPNHLEPILKQLYQWGVNEDHLDKICKRWKTFWFLNGRKFGGRITAEKLLHEFIFVDLKNSFYSSK